MKDKAAQNGDKWHGKTRGGNFGYWFFIQLLHKLGLGFAYFFLRIIVVYFAIFAPKPSSYQYQYLRKVHHFSRLKCLIGVIKNYFVFGQVILDKVALMSGIPTKFTYEFEGEKYLHQLSKDKKGGLLVGAHIGNWEIAGQLMERIDTRVHILMLEAEHQKIKSMLEKNMTKKNLQIIPIKNDLSHLDLIKQALEKNEFVAMHGDRFVGTAKHFYCDFFGRKAAFPTGPFYMAMKFGVPISFVSAVKESSTHYHLFCTKPEFYKKPTSPKLRDQQIKQVLNSYIANMEELLKRYPLQWFNYYDFWA